MIYLPLDVKQSIINQQKGKTANPYNRKKNPIRTKSCSIKT